MRGGEDLEGQDSPGGRVAVVGDVTTYSPEGKPAVMIGADENGGGSVRVTSPEKASMVKIRTSNPSGGAGGTVEQLAGVRRRS